MKFIAGWITLLLVIMLTLGWAEFGVCWIACMSVMPPECFIPLLLICLTVNMLIALMWMMLTQGKIDKDEAKAKRLRKKRIKRRRTKCL